MPVAPAASPAQPRRTSRIDVVDWLRGLAVVLMILAHAYDAWLLPAAKTGFAYEIIRHLSGVPSRLFLFLVGVSMAIRFESQLAKGVRTGVMRRGVMKRGLEILALAYLFRLQEFVLAGFHGGWQQLFRIDILNSIGASILVVALLAVPRDGRRQFVVPAIASAIFIALGPIVGPAHFSTWLPAALTSYLGGQRPMSWFPIFPWAAWALIGVMVGHVWLRARDDREQARAFIATAVAGGLLILLVTAVRAVAPDIIRYPSVMVQQMGPGSFLIRLGVIGGIALAAYGLNRLSANRYSPMRQLGQTSLLIYWIHVDLCYGHLAAPLKKKLSLEAATVGFVLLTVLMWAVSFVKTRYGRAIWAWLRRTGAWLASRLVRRRRRT